MRHCGQEGHTGVLQRVEDDSIWVKLDKHFPELNEWDNEVQIFGPNRTTAKGIPATQALRRGPGSLSDRGLPAWRAAYVLPHKSVASAPNVPQGSWTEGLGSDGKAFLGAANQRLLFRSTTCLAHSLRPIRRTSSWSYSAAAKAWPSCQWPSAGLPGCAKNLCLVGRWTISVLEMSNSSGFGFFGHGCLRWRCGH